MLFLGKSTSPIKPNRRHLQIHVAIIQLLYKPLTFSLKKPIGVVILGGGYGRNCKSKNIEIEIKIITMSGKPEKSHLKRSNHCRRRSVMNDPPFCYAAENLFHDNTKTKKRGGSSKILLHEGKKVVEPLGILMSSSDHRDEQGNSNATMICSSHGSISVIGRRRTMEDAVTVLPGVKVGEFDTSYDFFAVYDGHGGATVANACRDRMHQLVAMEVEKGSLGGDGKGLNYWKKVMGLCFTEMDEEVIKGGGGGGGGDVEEATLSEKTTVGSTAVVVLVGKEELVVANCGDSRAVLCRGCVAMALSNDHKPDRPDERERVEAAGGRVIDWNGSRVLGVLGTSRSIGDQYLKPFVTSEPEISVTERTESDDFVVIATDGLWDVISNEVACEVVKKCFDGRLKNRKFLDEFGGRSAAEAAALLAELAMARGSKDNISVIVVELKSSK